MAVDKNEFPEADDRQDGAESGDESDDDAEEDVPLVEVDLTGLHPLSPEVISKQVCSWAAFNRRTCAKSARRQ
jgi:hypothetical protein